MRTNNRAGWLLRKARDIDTLNDWEESFLLSLEKQQERQGEAFELSDRQMDVLERICVEKG